MMFGGHYSHSDQGGSEAHGKRFHIDEPFSSAWVSTGHLPAGQQIDTLLAEAYDRYKDVNYGVVADYIPALAAAPPDLFAICIAGVGGSIQSVGDVSHEFSIQSISKPFVFALVCQALGGGEARRKIGVNSTGLPFNSVMAIELNPDRTMNPMVNAGAIATTSLAPGETAEARWQFIRNGLSRLAGRELKLDEDVYASEATTNDRNRGIARLLHSYQRIYSDLGEATDIYTRQSFLNVTVTDLAVMGGRLQMAA